MSPIASTTMALGTDAGAGGNRCSQLDDAQPADPVWIGVDRCDHVVPWNEGFAQDHWCGARARWASLSGRIATKAEVTS